MNKNNKILIATGIYPPDIGGPATIVGELSNSLSANGYEVKVITYALGNESDDKVIRIKKQGRLAKIRYLFYLLRLSFSFDVIYATDTYSVGYFCYLLKKFFHRSYIIRFAGDSAWETAFNHGWTRDYITDFEQNIYDKKIQKLKKRRTKILQSADKVIAVSEFMSGVAQTIGVKSDKIKVIYNSVDFEKCNLINRDELFSKYGLSPTDKLIMTACRLTPWKGIDGLIAVVKELRNKLPIKLMILGDGPEMAKLKSLSRTSGVEEAIIFAGVIEQSKMIGYLSVADLFVLNTYYEGLSHTLLEAIKAKVPIIASNVGGNPEVIDDGVSGILVDYNDQAGLMTAIENILINPDKAQDFVNMAQSQSVKFNWSQVVTKTMEVITEIK